MPLEGYKNITKAAMVKFNSSMPDPPDVKCVRSVCVCVWYVS